MRRITVGADAPGGTGLRNEIPAWLRRITVGADAPGGPSPQLITDRHITIHKLATLSGVTQSTVQNITGGRNHSTAVSTVQKLCDGLGISIREFFDSPMFENNEQEIR